MANAQQQTMVLQSYLIFEIEKLATFCLHAFLLEPLQFNFRQK